MKPLDFSSTFPKRTKVSGDFIFEKFIIVFGIIGFAKGYLEERKVDGLYEELCFFGVLLFLGLLFYIFTRSKAYFDNSILYFKELNKAEIQIPLKTIHSIEKTSYRRGISSYKIEYYGEGKEPWTVEFDSDSWDQVEKFIKVTREVNPSLYTIGIFP